MWIHHTHYQNQAFWQFRTGLNPAFTIWADKTPTQSELPGKIFWLYISSANLAGTSVLKEVTQKIQSAVFRQLKCLGFDTRIWRSGFEQIVSSTTDMHGSLGCVIYSARKKPKTGFDNCSTLTESWLSILIMNYHTTSLIWCCNDSIVSWFIS